MQHLDPLILRPTFSVWVPQDLKSGLGDVVRSKRCLEDIETVLKRQDVVLMLLLKNLCFHGL